MKYRGRRVDGTWIYGNLIVDEAGEKHIVQPKDIVMDGHHIVIDTDTPMFFEQETITISTGMCDQDEEIFEKDIVRSGFYHMDGVVQFADGCFEVLFADGKREYLKCLVANHDVHVIGNIFNTKKGA